MNTGRSRLKLSNQEPLAEASRTLNRLRILHRKGPPTSTILRALASMAIVMEWLDAQLREEAKVATMVSVVPTLVTKERSVDDKAQREQTFGEKAVGLTFNPSGDPNVNMVKALYAQIIDICHDARTKAGGGETGRLFSVAITEAQTAQMWAVKAITWRD